MTGIYTFHRMGRVKIGILGFLTGLLMTLFAGISLASADPSQSNLDAPIPSGVIEGKILEVEEQTLVVKSRESGKVLRIPMPLKSHKNADDFRVGEQIEAMISPNGVTTSVVSLDGQLRR